MGQVIRMNKKVIVVLVLFTLLVSMLLTIQPTYASHRTITVPDNYSTINGALQNASDGDTVFVRKGTYTERFVIDKALSLKGEDKDATIINGNNSGTVVLIRHDNVEVSGFTIIYGDTPNHPYSQWMWSTRLIGIHLLSVKGCNVNGNKIMDCGAGIWLYDSPQNIITDNYLFRNDYGIRVELTSNNVFERNTETGNWAGMRFISSGNNKLRNNTMNSNTENFAILGAEPCYINDVDTSNTVDGRPIYYWIGVSHQSVPSDAGCVFLVNCVGVIVQGLSLSKNSDGIILVGCLNCLVANNTIRETNSGISTHSSISTNIVGNNLDCINAINANGNGTRITNNIIIASAIGVGAEGNYQTVADNTVTITQWQGYMIKCSGSYNTIIHNSLNGTSYTYGTMDGSNNVFYQNTMTNCYQLNVNSSESIIAKNDVTGIDLLGGWGTVVCGNRVINGLGIGVGGQNNVFYANHIEGNAYGATIIGSQEISSSNKMYHNNFVKNREQVRNWENPSNFWDNGAEGNYWSDYTGADADGNGIGDLPYLVMGRSLDEVARKILQVETGKDNYPLMMPFDISTVTVELPQWNYATPDSITQLTIPNPSPDTPSIVAHALTPSDVPSAPSQEQAQIPISAQPKPIPTDVATIVAVLSAAIITLGLLVYFKKHN